MASGNKFQFTMLPTNPHFIQPLLPGFHHELAIPVAFFKYLKETEHQFAKLRGRGGKIWDVKINGRSFKDGWEKFVIDHGLQIGQILLFRHEKDLIFEVIVFDESCCQRKYQPFPSDIQEEEVEEEEEEEVEEEEEEEPKQQQPPRSHLEHFDTREIAENGEITTRMTSKAISSMIRHPYFLITITPENAQTPSMHIPITFARLHNLTHRCCQIILLDQQERSWIAMLRHKNTTGQIYIGEGWSTFRTANNFQAGDSLICEMIKNDTDIVFKISGSREHHSMKRDTPTASLLIKNPYFSVIMKETGLKRSHLNIPVSFARLNGLIGRNCEMILIDERESSWPAMLGCSKDGRSCISKGWIEFARANGITKGDVFMLELVDVGKLPIMKFHGYSMGGCGARY